MMGLVPHAVAGWVGWRANLISPVTVKCRQGCVLRLLLLRWGWIQAQPAEAAGCLAGTSQILTMISAEGCSLLPFIRKLQEGSSPMASGDPPAFLAALPKITDPNSHLGGAFASSAMRQLLLERLGHTLELAHTFPT